MKFECPICGHSLEVKQSLAGKSGRCPNCEKKIEIPDDPESEQTSDSEMPPPPPPAPRDQPTADISAENAPPDRSWDRTLLTRLIETGIPKTRFVSLIPNIWNEYMKWSGRIALWAIIAFGLTLVVHLSAFTENLSATKRTSYAAAVFILALGLHYFANVFWGLTTQTLTNDKISFQSTAFPQTIGLIAGVTAFGYLLFHNEYGLATFVLTSFIIHIGIVCLNADVCMNIHTAERADKSPEADALSILMFFPRLGAALIPIILSHGMIYAVGKCGMNLYQGRHRGIFVYADTFPLMLVVGISPFFIYILHLAATFATTVLGAICNRHSARPDQWE